MLPPSPFPFGSPVFGVLPPIVILAVYHIFAYASAKFSSNELWKRYGSRGHRWLQAKQKEALLFNAVSEVSLGFLTIVSLLSPSRSFVKVYFVWTILRLRYSLGSESGSFNVNPAAPLPLHSFLLRPAPPCDFPSIHICLPEAALLGA